MSKSRHRPKKRKIKLQRTLFLLPNLITLSSVFCGFYSMVVSVEATASEGFNRAALLIIFAMFFDMLDGRVARMTKTESAFGLQIDSLADAISFGAAPALLFYNWSLHNLGIVGVIGAFAFTACGVIRLARFNVLSTDKSGAPSSPGKYFVGLPIPPAAGVLVSVVMASHAVGAAISNPRYAVWLLVLIGVLALLMVSNIRFRSFKDLKLNLRSALLVAFVFASSTIVSIRLSPVFVLVWLLGCYVAIGLGELALSILLKLFRRSAAPDPPIPVVRGDND